MCSGFAHPRLLVQVTLLCASAFIAPSLARAQHLPVLNGSVTDASNTPVFGAIVEVAGTALRGRTDEDGHFRIAGIGYGAIDITVRRLGFASVNVTAHVVANQQPAPLNIVLPALPTTVKPVVVQASRVEYSGRLAGYYERLHRRSNGVFIPREEIDRRSSRSLSHLLSSTPGISALRLRSGGAVRMRGRSCRPLVWLDGVPMPAGEVDLDAFPVNTLHGIELYLGSTTAPSTYTASQGQSSCGTILLWSRGRDTEPSTTRVRRNVDLEQLAVSRALYTADQVDRQAELREQPLAVDYPAGLFASGTAGSAVAEFIVDADGTIEAESFEIFFASHPLFGEAVREAMSRARYTPALKDGVAVRQLVQQPFTFSRGIVRTSASRQD
jgi:TonB family protein